jgi:probable F420-dependent oxidoreductase
MKFGVNVPNYGIDTSPQSLGDWAARLEEMGYHHLFLSDHVVLTPEVQHLFAAPFYDPFTVLSWMAGTTRRISLGTSVAILPYRNPVHLARTIANIDQLSGGRFIFGAAAGWAAGEFAALGIPYHSRGAVSDEYLEAIKACWAAETASYNGRHVSFDQVFTGPLPLQRPHPPIWIGGHSSGALRRAVRHGDAWHPTSLTADWLTGTGLPALRRIARQEGLPEPALAPRIKLRITDEISDPGRPLGAGSLDQIRRDLELLDGLGAVAVVLDPTFPAEPRTRQRARLDLANLELLAEKVLSLEHESLR